MASKGLGLVQTKGFFQAVGIISGVESDNFYREITTKTNKPMRMVGFSLEIDKGKKIYCSLSGMEKEKVYFSRQVGETKETKSIDWSERFDFNDNNWSLIGVTLGLEKETNSNGVLKNKKGIYTEYDACKVISEKLKDNMSVFVKGKIEHSTYDGRKSTKFIPTHIFLCSKEIDFDLENFEPKAFFEQSICFSKIEKSENNEFLITAKNISYSEINDIELFTKNDALAKSMKRELKEYNSILVFGNIEISEKVEDVNSTSSAWGSQNPMRVVFAPTEKRFEIIGANPETIDKEVYSEKIIEEAIEKINNEKKAKNDFSDLTGKSSSNDWGKVPFDIDEDDDIFE